MRILKQCLFSAFFTLSILSLAACGGSSNNHSGPANNPGNTNPGGSPGNPDGDGGNSGDGNSDGGDDNDGTTGTFSLAVTDAPVDNADHVYVAFTGVTLHPVDGDPVVFTFEEAQNVDLLTLQGTASERLLNEQRVPVGDYESVQLHLNASHDGVMDSYVEMNDGTQLELGLEEEDRLTIAQEFSIASNGHVDFTVDLDLRRSLILPEGETDLTLRPSLRLVHTEQAGSIACEVAETLISAACDDPNASLGVVYIYEGADVVPTDVSDEDGGPLTTAFVVFEEDVYTYEAGFLPAGEYTVAYTCDAINDDPQSVEEMDFYGVGNATVTAGEETLYTFGPDAVLYDGATAETE